MRTRTTSLIALMLLMTAIVLVNMLAQRYKFRLDLTGDKRYTLDQATLDLLHGLPEAVTVTAYFTEDLPPELAVVRQDFKDLLVEYAERSGGKLVFEFEDPGSSEAIMAKAVELGVRPLLAQTRAKDRSENIQVLMGAVVRMATRKAVIPALQKGPGMEWILSSAIAQVATVEKPLIGVMQGHQEPSLQALDELAVQLNAQYDVEATAIYDSFPINERFASILIIDPKDSISPQHQKRIDEYMAKGHGVVLAYSAVATDLTVSPEAQMRDIGIVPWLAERGVRIGPGVMVDEHCGQVGVTQSGIQTPISIQFPFYPLLNNFSKHPVAHGLDLVMFQFASPITFIGDSTTTSYSPLLSTSATSNVLPAPLNIDSPQGLVLCGFPARPASAGRSRGTQGQHRITLGRVQQRELLHGRPRRTPNAAAQGQSGPDGERHGLGDAQHATAVGARKGEGLPPDHRPGRGRAHDAEMVEPAAADRGGAALRTVPGAMAPSPAEAPHAPRPCPIKSASVCSRALSWHWP